MTSASYRLSFQQIFVLTRIFGALTGPKILAGTAPIKVGSARLVLVDLVACFEFLSANCLGPPPFPRLSLLPPPSIPH